MSFFDFLLYEHLRDADRSRRLRQIAVRARSMKFPGAPEDETETLRRENHELRLCLTAVVQALVEKGVLQPDEIEQKLAALMPETTESPADSTSPADKPDEPPLPSIRV